MSSSTPLAADLIVAFNLGLASQVHCLGMCGGIVGAFSAAGQGERLRGAARAGHALAYNGGRVTSYAMAGAILGALGAGALAAVTVSWGHLALRVIAGIVLVISGLALLGRLPRGLLLEQLGLSLWRHLQPLARRLLPIDSVPRAFAAGLLWGWLPCALVYSTLLFAMSRAVPTESAAVMVAFGAGTSPAMVGAAWLGQHAADWLRRPRVRQAAGIALVCIGLAYPWIGGWLHGAHAGHAHAGHAHGQEPQHMQDAHAHHGHAGAGD